MGGLEMFRSLIQKIKRNKFKCSLIFTLFLSLLYFLSSGLSEPVYFSLMIIYTNIIWGVLFYLILSFPFIDFKKDFLKNKRLYFILGSVISILYTFLGIIAFFTLFVEGMGHKDLNLTFLYLLLYLLIIGPKTIGSIYSVFEWKLPPVVGLLLIPIYPIKFASWVCFRFNNCIYF